MKTMGFKIDTNNTETTQTMLMPCDFKHGICIGMTGSGKTASLILPIMKDRLTRGHSLLAYTYKGHEHRKIKHLAKESNRLNDVIEIGKPHGKYINLMATLELNSVQKTLEQLISGLNSNGDSYWTLSAARLGVNIVNILRKLHKVDTILKSELGNTSHLRNVTIEEKDEDGTSLIKYQYPSGEPSFQTLSEISKSPKNLKRFYHGLEKLITNIRNTITVKEDIYNRKRVHEYSLFLDEEEYDNESVDAHEKNAQKFSENFIRKVVIALLRLNEAIAPYKDFSIDIKSNDGSGNNGVLQVLNNAVLNLANKDYINTADINLLDALNNGAIVIVDIEGIHSDIHGILLESILSKLSSRIRNGTPSPVSVFVDEANRVLLGSMDIHNDTLRESNVEIVLAIQNEEQMIEKFGTTKWESIRKNFQHNYWINQTHQITYNDIDNWQAEALLIDDNTLILAEYAFNALESNMQILKERFTFTGTLPKKFLTEYDIVHFEKEMSMQLIDENSNKKEVEYIGKDFKHKLEVEMMNFGYFPEVKFKINI